MRNVSRHTRNKRPETIKAALRAAGVPTVSDLARRLGRTRSLVSQVISGDTKSAALAGAIAALIGSQACDIWPRLYTASSEIPKAS